MPYSGARSRRKHCGVTTLGTSEVPRGRVPEIREQIVVGTPGRLKNLVATQRLPLSDVKVWTAPSPALGLT